MEDFAPYGFVEKAVIDAYGFDNYEYQLTDCTAYLVSERDFARVKGDLGAIEVNADVAGAKVYITHLFAEWCVLESLTGGDVKSLDIYREAESSRHLAWTTEGIISKINEASGVTGEVEVEAEDAGEVDVVEEAVVEVAAEVDTVDKTIDDYPDAKSNDFVMRFVDGRSIIYRPEMLEVVNAIDKDLFPGLDIVIPPYPIYGDPTSDYLCPGMINIPDAAVIYCSGDLSYTAVTTEFSGPTNRCTPEISGSDVNAGDYIVGRLNDRLLNILFKKNGKLDVGATITAIKSIGGEEFTYEYDVLIDSFSEFSNPTKTEDDLWVHIDVEWAKKLSKHYGKHVSSKSLACDNLLVISDSVYDVNTRSGEFTVLGEKASSIKIVSRYEDYDRIYRDTVSNIVFAVAKRDVITTLVDISQSSIVDAIIVRDNSSTYEEIHANDEKLYADLKAKSEDTYVEKFIRDAQSSINDKKAELEALTNDYDDKLKAIMSIASEIKSMSILLSSIDEDKINSDNREAAIRDFHNIMEIDVVNSIFVEEDYLCVFTNNIYVKHDNSGKWYDIGTFMIRVKINGGDYSESYTKILNTKTYIDAYEGGMNAPHVFRRGNLCHGNLTMGISESYKTGDMFGVVYQLITFLQAANLDDVAGRHVIDWDEVSEDVALGNSMDTETIYGLPEGFDMSAALEAVI